MFYKEEKMGWFDRFKKKDTKSVTYADTLSGITPVFTQFGTNIYASDVVQQAVNCIVMELKKLRPVHVRQEDVDAISVNGSIQSVLNNPNEFMTTSDFLEKIAWSYMLNYNAFIIPSFYEWEDKKGNVQRKYKALYPIQPIQVNFIQDSSDRLFVRFKFANGYETVIKYSDVIHIRKNYSVSEYMGGNESGQPDNQALLETLNLNHQLLQGVAKAMKATFAINGVVKYNTLIDDGKTETNLKKLEEKIRNSESGFLPIDLKSEFLPISHDVKLVDADTLKFIDEKILRHWGVPLPILTGDYTKEQYEAFYQKTLEPIIISMSQAFTKSLFTDRERSYGNRIQFYPKDLIFMSVDQTLEMVTLLSNTGAIFENEKRTAFGLPPIKELEGKRYMSLNWIDATISKQYQLDEGGENEK